MAESVYPADTYIVVNQTILTEIDKKTLISLYEPIIGPTAVSLYLTLWGDLDKQEMISKDYTHHHLMTILKSSLNVILSSRQSLEALGLLKSFVKRDENINEYLYELYSPMSPYDFFNHPVLSVVLLNNIGEIEYNNLLQYYKKKSVNKSDYEEITSSMNNTFKSVTPMQEQVEVRNVSRNDINLETVIDFDLLEMSLPKGMINSKTLNKKTKKLINQLAYIYDFDTIKMSEIIRLVIDEFGLIKKEKLREEVRKSYEFNNNGNLPNIIFKVQPEHLKSPEGDTSPRGKMIYVFENTSPYDFLKNKNKGIKPSSRDLKLIEQLAVDFELPTGVINVLIDYVLRINDGKLVPKYLEAIAGEWSRKSIKTVVDAISVAEKGHKKVVKNVKETRPKAEVKAPAWMFKENEKQEMSQEDIEEMEELLSEFR